MNPQTLADEIAKLELTDVAIVDCTASDLVVKAYPDFVKANLHIITPNKRANVLPYRQYADLMESLPGSTEIFLRRSKCWGGLACHVHHP